MRGADNAALQAQLERLRAQIVEAKAVNERPRRTTTTTTKQTRDRYIDLLLHEAGWPLDGRARP